MSAAGKVLMACFRSGQMTEFEDLVANLSFPVSRPCRTKSVILLMQRLAQRTLLFFLRAHEAQ